MNIEEILAKAEEIKNVQWDSPKIKIWIMISKKFIEDNYGDQYAEVFEASLFPRVYSRDLEANQRNYIKRIENAMDYIKELDNIPAVMEGKNDENFLKNNSACDEMLKGVHREIYEKCHKLFADGFFAESVEKSFKVVRDKLRSLTSFETGSEAFGKGGLFINGATSYNVEHDFNEGVKFLTMAIDKFRNEKAHTSDAKINDSIRAYEYLRISSLAMHLLDQSEIRKQS